MTYEFMCNGEKIRVWVSSYNEYVSIETKKKSYDRSVREDQDGRKFFTWNKCKIYLDNWVRTSMKELQKRIDNKEFIRSDDLCIAIMSDGVENVRFEVPMNTRCGPFFLNGNEFKNTICKIEETWNREVKNGYKFKLVPVEYDSSISPSRDFYVSDFTSLIESGHIKIILNEEEKEKKDETETKN